MEFLAVTFNHSSTKAQQDFKNKHSTSVSETKLRLNQFRHESMEIFRQLGLEAHDTLNALHTGPRLPVSD